MAMNELTQLARALLATPALSAQSRASGDDGVRNTEFKGATLAGESGSASGPDGESPTIAKLADFVRTVVPDISREVAGEIREITRSPIGTDSAPAVSDRGAQVLADLQVLASVQDRSAVAMPYEPRVSTAASSSEDSLAGSVLKTAGMLTGAGPLVGGLLKLFGSGNGPEPPPQLFPYQHAAPISMEAGLNEARSFVPVSYGSSGLARQGGPQPIQNSPPAAQIQVNVNAIDSRSFLDHSDEIARAVRDAMLRSHSLNDVISEI